jgi:putative oxidoreductase
VKVLALICQVLLGLMFIVFGLNGFLHFMPMGPTPPPDSPIGKFFSVMMGSGWMAIVSGLQVLGGLLVIAGVTAPLGLVLLGPIIFNALLFHILLAGGHGIGPAAFAAVLEVVLIYAYRAYFAGIFSVRARPAA